MVSERKREANRKNAQKPRGPRKRKLTNFHPYTDFGAFHWDFSLFAELKAGYRETLQPQNRLEESLVDILCHAMIRLQRVPYLEHEYHATHPKGFLFNEKETHFGPFYRAESKLFYTQLSRYETSAQRSFYKALNTLLKLQNERLTDASEILCRGAACGAHPSPQSLYPLDPQRPRPRAGAASGAPTGEPGASIPPCGRDDTGFLEEKRENPPKKTSKISHQIPPDKSLKTQATLENPPQKTPWLTRWLATVSQKIQQITQTLQTGILGIFPISWGIHPIPRRGTACCARPSPQNLYPPDPKGPTPTSGPAGKPARTGGNAIFSPTGPDPPDSS